MGSCRPFFLHGESFILGFLTIARIPHHPVPRLAHPFALLLRSSIPAPEGDIPDVLHGAIAFLQDLIVAVLHLQTTVLLSEMADQAHAGRGAHGEFSNGSYGSTAHLRILNGLGSTHAGENADADLILVAGAAIARL